MARRELSLGVLFTGKVDASFGEAINKLRQSVEKLNTQQAKMAADAEKPFAGMGKGFKGYIRDVEKIIELQMRWYGAKFILFNMFQVPIDAIKSVIQYSGEIDQARAEMLRWAATSGSVGKDVEQVTDAMMLNIRKVLTEYPLTLKEISGSVQAFLGAGMSYRVVNQMVEDIAKLKTAFKEINFDTFAVAITGAFKTMRDNIRGANGEILDDAGKMKVIFEQILRAQAVGIIRPEQFTKVIQYMGQIGKLSGFSLEQILAMSVAITDTGISANNASRLTAGWMLSLQQPRAQNAIKSLGIEINKDLPLAKNLDNIMMGLSKRLGEGGPASMKAMEFMQTLTSADRLKALLTFVSEYGKYVELQKDIAGATGGLTAAAKIMQLPLPAQWTIFLNILKEIGATANQASVGGMKSLLGVIIDIGRGMLYAIDNTGRFNDKMGSLGTEGLAAYKSMKQLMEVLGAIKDQMILLKDIFVAILSPIKAVADTFEFLWSVLKKIPVIGDVASGLKKVADESNLLSNIIGGVLLTMLGAKILKLFGVKRATEDVAKASLRLKTEWKLLPAVATGFGNALWLIATEIIPLLILRFGKLGFIIAGIVAALGAMHAYATKDNKDWEGFAAKSNFEISNLPQNEEGLYSARTIIVQEQEFAKQRQEAWAKNREMLAPSEDTFATAGETVTFIPGNKADDWQKTETGKEEVEHKKRLAAVIVAERAISEAVKTERKNRTGTGEFPEKLEKASTFATRMALKRLNTEISFLKTWESYYLTVLKNVHQIGMINDEELFQAKMDMTNLVMEKELKAVDLAKQLIDANIEEVQGSSSSPEMKRRKTIELNLDKEVLDIRAKGLILQQKHLQNEYWLQDFLRKRKDMLAEINHLEEKRMINAEIISAVGKERISGEREFAEYDYGKGYTSATQYYDKINDLIVQDADNAKTLEDEKFDSKMAKLAAEYYGETEMIGDIQITRGASVERQRELLREMAITEAKHVQDSVAIQLDASTKRRAAYLKEKEDYNKIWEKGSAEGGWQGGLRAVVSKNLGDLYAELSKTGDQINKLTTSIAQGMMSSFEEFFFDALSGKMKSFEDYFTSFLDMLRRELAKFFAAQAMRMILGGLGAGGDSWLSTLVSFGGAMMGAGGAGGGGFEAGTSGDILTSGSVDTSAWSSGYSQPITPMEFHKGGVVGVSQVPKRIVPSHIFENAPYLHSGLKSNEFAAILKKQESVLTPDDVGVIKAGLSQKGGLSMQTTINLGGGSAQDGAELQALMDRTVRDWWRSKS